MPTVDAQQVQEKVFEALRELVDDPDAIRRDATLEELDVDSLDLVEITQILEEEFGVEILGEARADSSDGKRTGRGETTLGEAIDALTDRVLRAAHV